MKKTLEKDFFMSIVRLAKSQSAGIVYLEFECNEIVDDNHRHYAVADVEIGLGSLPRIVRLPEDRNKFSIESVKQAMH